MSPLVHGTIIENDTTAASQLSTSSRRLQFIRLQCDTASTFYFGTSTVCSTSGYTIPPRCTNLDNALVLNFRPDSVSYSNLYVASNSTGHRVDWVGIVEK